MKWCVLALSEAPVMASHSNAKSVCNHPRNLDDDRISRIASNGGMVGVVFLGRFVAEQEPKLEHVLDHVDHIVGIAGSG